MKKWERGRRRQNRKGSGSRMVNGLKEAEWKRDWERQNGKGTGRDRMV